MSGDFEQCRMALGKLAEEYAKIANKGQLNEATTRLRFIDSLFFECLGWDKEDCDAEESYYGKFTDYEFYAVRPRKALIVEAKKEGTYFELPTGYARRDYLISSIIRDFSPIGKAIQQAISYCQERGVLFGAVCNGHQIVCFLASRDDGIPPLEGKAIIFDSLQNMHDNFVEFWQLLSKMGIMEERLKGKLLGEEPPILPIKLSSRIMPYPGFRNRNIIQTDLQSLGEIVIEDIANDRENEADFIRECYCVSGALSQYALQSKAILEQRYASLFDNRYDHPHTEKATTKKGISSEVFAESLSSRPILLIGDVGVGKTMFVRYVMNIEAVEVLKDSIALYIDLGSKASLSENLKKLFIAEIKSQLLNDYDIDVEERAFVRGVYNVDIERFRKSIYSDLIETDPLEYAYPQKLDS